MDRDADLNTPATTPSGCVDGMVVSHLTGRGAAELVRFWGEPPLVREPDLALFGVERLDRSEDELLQRSTIRSYLAKDVKRTGAAVVAQTAVDRIRGNGYQFVLHFDVDVIADFQSTNYPGSGGLTLEEVRDALMVFVSQKHLAAMEVTAYNPAKDGDGSGAKLIIDLLAEVFAARLEALNSASAITAQGPESSVARPRKRNRLRRERLPRTKPAIRYCLLLNRAKLGLPIHSMPITTRMLADPVPIATILVRLEPHLKQMGRLPERISENLKPLTLMRWDQ